MILRPEMAGDAHCFVDFDEQRIYFVHVEEQWSYSFTELTYHYRNWMERVLPNDEHPFWESLPEQ